MVGFSVWNGILAQLGFPYMMEQRTMCLPKLLPHKSLTETGTNAGKLLLPHGFFWQHRRTQLRPNCDWEAKWNGFYWCSQSQWGASAEQEGTINLPFCALFQITLLEPWAVSCQNKKSVSSFNEKFTNMSKIWWITALAGECKSTLN